MQMKRMVGGFFCALFLSVSLTGEAFAAELQEQDLYAGAAVLMDADSGRVLYGKNADAPMAMASTTKIMTCILLLENGCLEEELQVSAYAASMPKVKLYIKKGETYRVKDLLYSLMLESHNDSAVALAEHLGKQYLGEELKNKAAGEYSVEESREAVAAFAALMNQKAAEIGCEDTWFITPNGLDATETFAGENGESITREHHTTAKELAEIMSYCITRSPERENFLNITRTANHSFSANGRTFSCMNHNSFLNMMDGALSGKTGFTNKAGYCYVGALQRDGRTFTVALLACGWPNHKTWKWMDSRALFSYGLENFTYREYAPQVKLESIPVRSGASPNGNPYQGVSVRIQKNKSVLPFRLLTGEGEKVVAYVKTEKVLEAPVEKGREVGYIRYYLVETEGTEHYLAEELLLASDSVGKADFWYFFRFVLQRFV